MTFFNKVLNPFQAPLVEEWIQRFNELEGTLEFPMSLSLRSLEDLEESSGGDDIELRRCLLEDIIFNSISAYFYEDLVQTINENPDVATELLEKFSERTEEMDEEVARETADHCNYIEHENFCEGCPSCDKHKDFAPLIGPWARNDTDHFIREYLKIKTLHFSLEQVIFDVLPNQKNHLNNISLKDVEIFKHHVRGFVERKLSSI